MACTGKRQINYMLGCLGLQILLLSGCGISGKRHSTLEEPYRLTTEDKALLQEGDIILRQGEGILSSMILRQLRDTIPASHCGILIPHGADWDVIHALSLDVSDTDGVQCCPLDEFMNDCVPGSICVLRCLADTAGVIAPQARYYLAVHKPFDRTFSLKDSTSFFCSELPYRILKDRLDIDLTPASGSFRFSSFFNPAYFQVIYQGDAYRKKS